MRITRKYTVILIVIISLVIAAFIGLHLINRHYLNVTPAERIRNEEQERWSRNPEGINENELLRIAHYHTSMIDRGRAYLILKAKGQTGGLSGKFSFFFPNGNKWGIHTWENGVRHGESFEWYDNGNLKDRGKYVDGEKHGKWENYSRKGYLDCVVTWDMGNCNPDETVCYDLHGNKM